MTQTKVERKYFRSRVNEKLQNKASLNSKKLALAEEQELTTNITGGASGSIINTSPTDYGLVTPSTIREDSSQLLNKHIKECCVKRGLDRDWIEAGCSSLTTTEATDKLYYTAKSAGILIEGANAQYQYRPDQPWADKQGKKAPKYRTAAGDEYDALLPKHPTDSNYWLDTSKLKQRCYQINGHPMLLVTEGGFKAIAACSHDIPTIALLGVEMGLTPTKDDPQGKRYLVPELENLAKKEFGFILAFDADTLTA